jgi:hypothetical protein
VSVAATYLSTHQRSKRLPSFYDRSTLMRGQESTLVEGSTTPSKARAAPITSKITSPAVARRLFTFAVVFIDTPPWRDWQSEARAEAFLVNRRFK